MTNSSSTNLFEVARFGVVDYIFLFAMLIISTAIGIYHACSGGKQKTTKEFLLGNRSMTFFPVVLSLFATFVSATTLLGFTAEIYTFGSQIIFVIIGDFLLFPAVLYLFLPVFYELGTVSVNEYLGRRFNSIIRRISSTIYILQTVMCSAALIYAPALALTHATGLNFWLIVTIVIGICTLYTTIGGIKAVMWTDVMQSIIMIVAILVIIFNGSKKVGGLDNILLTAMQGERIELFNSSFDLRVRHTIWTQTIGVLFTAVPSYAINQAQVQRYLSAQSLKTAKRALWGNFFGWIWVHLSCAVLGFIIYARYHDCDPVSAGLIKRNDQLLPLFAMDTLGGVPGFSGLFVAGLLSGSLSSLSTALNSLAAVTLEDFIKTSCWNEISDRKAVVIVKLLAFSYGVICLACIGVIGSFQTIIEAVLGIMGLLGGPIFGVFILGMFFPWTNSWGAGLGLLLGLVQSFWIAIGVRLMGIMYQRLPVSVEGCSVTNSTLISFTGEFDYTRNATTKITFVESYASSQFKNTDTDSFLVYMYSISYMWYSAIACFIVVITGLIISFITGPTDAKDLDPQLLSPITKSIMNKIPKGWRKFLKCDNSIQMKEVQLLEDFTSGKMSDHEIAGSI